MSLSKRVNVFLERARQLQSSSPKLAQISRSPVKQVPQQTSKPASPITQTIHPSENHLLQNLELMIDSFIKSRTDTSKRFEVHKQKEYKFIEEIKKSLDLEIEKSRSSGLAEIEKEYKEKTEKVLMIVKQEAMNIDRKLAAIQTENSKLKQLLSEKNIEVVDRKILQEAATVDQVLQSLLGHSTDTNEESKQKLNQLLQLKGTVYDGSLDQILTEILQGHSPLPQTLAKEILTRHSEWQECLNNLQSEIESRRKKYQKLDKRIKTLNSKTQVMYEDEEFFGSRQTRSATFGSQPALKSISAEEVLESVYQEVLDQFS